MKIRNFILFACLAIAQALFANNPGETFHMPKLVYSGELTCNLAPPSSLNVDVVGSDWLRVSWTPVIGANQYLLQSFDGASGDPLSAPLLVPGTATSADISTAGNNGSAFVRIWSVCPDNSLSATFTQSATVDTIIIELIVNGFEGFPPCYNLSAPIGVGYANGQEITWNTSQTYFMATYNGIVRRFSVHVEGPINVKVHMGESGNEGEYIVFTDFSFNGLEQPVNFAVRFRENLSTKPTDAKLIGVVTAAKPIASGPGNLFKDINPNNTTSLEIRKVTPAPPCGLPEVSADSNAGLVEKDQLQDDIIQHAIASPNPFHDRLRLQLPASKDPNGARINIYNMLGVRQISYQVPAGQSECTLGTSHLETGMYFVEIESDGQTQTIKTVKN